MELNHKQLENSKLANLQCENLNKFKKFDGNNF